ncbi:MAG: hypothetical protein OXC19_02850 [Bryobacterales bacterium]|nr:hypothetical protein [Bryobacterales bacterium]
MSSKESDLETAVAKVQALARKHGSPTGSEVDDFIAGRRVEAAKESGDSDSSCFRIDSGTRLARSARATRCNLVRPITVRDAEFRELTKKHHG